MMLFLGAEVRDALDLIPGRLILQADSSWLETHAHGLVVLLAGGVHELEILRHSSCFFLAGDASHLPALGNC